MRLLAPFLALFMVACATAPGPTPAELGNRIRIRIAGRGKVPSITTADYFLYLMVRGPDGGIAATRLLAPETMESEGLSLILGKRIEALFELPDVELTETLHGDPSCGEDIVLPAGCTLCFAPGSYYAYRIVDRSRIMTADLAPEIQLGVITADGSRYVELQPAAGPALERAKDPPSWPLTSGL